ncbi:NAD(P)H dehydrogenase (quinone) [Marinobacterium zhoushanense]|uniref:NAD(P)H dehydrogenase (Quinone) n=1 Tax=Marinobacterium zhoushanense TaxID=1679163 RepID=A0ABQ1KH64_9GAMM|nr:NAD(P)H-dependent oxidoreductase [Marinobacterium zhoushanense]GGB96191.1 NAD(P)H dehydrogenase (quinone) [Marinobacterium zhoushanense]
MKRILIINANPKSASLGKVMAERYANRAREKHQIELINIGDMQFNLNLEEGYDKTTELEDDLQDFQQKLKWSQHIVIITPVWWGGMPAKLKGVFDRVLLPGYAFKYHEGKSIPEKLLTGRTSELIITLDTPTIWYRWIQGNPIYHQLKRTIFDFIGIKNKATHYFGPVISADEKQRERWLNRVEKLAN